MVLGAVREKRLQSQKILCDFWAENCRVPVPWCLEHSTRDGARSHVQGARLRGQTAAAPTPIEFARRAAITCALRRTPQPTSRCWRDTAGCAGTLPPAHRGEQPRLPGRHTAVGGRATFLAAAGLRAPAAEALRGDRSPGAALRRPSPIPRGGRRPTNDEAHDDADEAHDHRPPLNRAVRRVRHLQRLLQRRSVHRRARARSRQRRWGSAQYTSCDAIAQVGGCVRSAIAQPRAARRAPSRYLRGDVLGRPPTSQRRRGMQHARTPPEGYGLRRGRVVQGAPSLMKSLRTWKVYERPGVPDIRRAPPPPPPRSPRAFNLLGASQDQGGRRVHLGRRVARQRRCAGRAWRRMAASTSSTTIQRGKGTRRAPATGRTSTSREKVTEFGDDSGDQ